MQGSGILEEALADAKNLRRLAEQNAKNAIIEAVTPRIKDMIEAQMGVSSLNEEESKDLYDKIMTDSTEVNFPHPDEYGKESEDQESYLEIPEYSIAEGTDEKDKQEDATDQPAGVLLQQVIDLSQNVKKFRKVIDKFNEKNKQFNNEKSKEIATGLNESILKVYESLLAAKDVINNNAHVFLKEQLELINHQLNKSFDKRISGIQDNLFKLNVYSQRIDESTSGSDMNPKLRKAYLKLYSKAVVLERYNDINRKVVTILQRNIISKIR
jgi:molecular chaperone GrpE (heat shock protein)